MYTKLSPALIAAFVLISFVAPSMAQTDHSMHGNKSASSAPSASSQMGEGLVKKVDKAKGTVTLAHGALPNGMPPMTMAYRVKNVAWLDTLKAGQTIRFSTDPAEGDMTLVRFELVK